MDGLKTAYQGFTIVYQENTNDWKILDDGVHGDKRKPTLLDAKKWIESTFKTKKKNTFQRQSGLVNAFRGVEVVAVTSFAGATYCGHLEYWITTENGSRKKAAGVKQYDEAAYLAIQQKSKQREQLQSEIDDLWEKIPLFTAGQED